MEPVVSAVLAQDGTVAHRKAYRFSALSLKSPAIIFCPQNVDLFVLKNQVELIDKYKHVFGVEMWLFV